LNSFLKYNSNIFWNLIIQFLISVILISYLYFKKTNKKHDFLNKKNKLISNFQILLILIFIFSLMFNFSEITNKIQFISQGNSINLNELEKGDILFEFSGNSVSIIPGYWSHLALYLGNINGTPSVIESTLNGVNINSLQNFVKDYRVSVAKVNLSNKSRKKIINWAISKKGLPYDFFMYTKEENGTSYYCSELIWAGYKQVGIDLDKYPGFRFKYLFAVAPQEIFIDDDIIIYHINNTIKNQINSNKN